MEFLSNKLFLIAVTFISFLGAQILQRRTGIKFLNPILVSIVLMIIFLRSLGIDYETYRAGGEYIELWLKPAVVALGLPLYKQLSSIRKQLFSGSADGQAAIQHLLPPGRRSDPHGSLAL